MVKMSNVNNFDLKDTGYRYKCIFNPSQLLYNVVKSFVILKGIYLIFLSAIYQLFTKYFNIKYYFIVKKIEIIT